MNTKITIDKAIEYDENLLYMNNYVAEWVHALGIEAAATDGWLVQLEQSIARVKITKTLLPYAAPYGNDLRLQKKGIALQVLAHGTARLFAAKLLELRLYAYHRLDTGERDRFLFVDNQHFKTWQTAQQFCETVLATPAADRKNTASPLPYLNCPLFASSDLEQIWTDIIDDLPNENIIFSKNSVTQNTVVRDTNITTIKTLDYFVLLLNNCADFAVLSQTWTAVSAKIAAVFEAIATPKMNFDADILAAKNVDFVGTASGAIVVNFMQNYLSKLNINTIYYTDNQFNFGINEDNEPINYEIKFERKIRKLPVNLQAPQTELFEQCAELMRRFSVSNTLPHCNTLTQASVYFFALQFLHFRKGNNTQIMPFESTDFDAMQCGSVLFDRTPTDLDAPTRVRLQKKLHALRTNFFERFEQVGFIAAAKQEKIILKSAKEKLQKEIKTLEQKLKIIPVPPQAAIAAHEYRDTIIIDLHQKKYFKSTETEFLEREYSYFINRKAYFMDLEAILPKNIEKIVLIVNKKIDKTDLSKLIKPFDYFFDENETENFILLQKKS